MWKGNKDVWKMTEKEISQVRQRSFLVDSVTALNAEGVDNSYLMSRPDIVMALESGAEPPSSSAASSSTGTYQPADAQLALPAGAASDFPTFGGPDSGKRAASTEP